MQTSLLWTGSAYHSLENCVLTTTGSGAEASSIILGYYAQKIYRVDYRIKTNTRWETVFCEISSQLNSQTQLIRLESDGKGNWLQDGKQAHQFDGCIDVDIALTPFTNTLPIRRLKLASNEEQNIRVIYLDLLEGQIRPVQQRYVRLSETRYHYENIPNDFEANIQVDESGFVVDYPPLFVRTAVIKSE